MVDNYEADRLQIYAKPIGFAKFIFNGGIEGNSFRLVASVNFRQLAAYKKRFVFSSIRQIVCSLSKVSASSIYCQKNLSYSV
jgi:hypothetical protein